MFRILFILTFLTFFVWWTVAVWFPELGLTYWQLLLPVYTFRLLTQSAKFAPILPKGFKNYL